MSKTREKTKIGIEIPTEVYKRTKLASALEGKKFQDIVTDALTEELNRLGIPMIEDIKKPDQQ